MAARTFGLFQALQGRTASINGATQIRAGVIRPEVIVPLEGVIDIAAEKARLEKAQAASQKEAKSLEGRLSNPAFVEKAKPEAVEKARYLLEHRRFKTRRSAENGSQTKAGNPGAG